MFENFKHLRASSQEGMVNDKIRQSSLEPLNNQENMVPTTMNNISRLTKKISSKSKDGQANKKLL